MTYAPYRCPSCYRTMVETKSPKGHNYWRCKNPHCHWNEDVAKLLVTTEDVTPVGDGFVQFTQLPIFLVIARQGSHYTLLHAVIEEEHAHRLAEQESNDHGEEVYVRKVTVLLP